MFKNLSKLDKNELIYLHKLTVIEKLLGDIAHKFNNQLGGIKDCTEAALDDGSSEAMKKTLELTLPVVGRACSLTRMVTDFARAGSAGREKADLAQALEMVLTLRSYSLQKKRIQITKEHAEVPMVSLNSGEILQVLLALIMNAEEVMENGGTLAISLKPFPEEKEIEICFKHSAQARDGTLGLIAAREILKKQGGQFHVDSDEEGSVVTLRLPLPETSSELPEQAQGELKDAEETSKKSLNILIIEDEEIYRQLLSDLLGKAGHNCEAVSDGEKALEKVKGKDYDLALIDINLPEMDGFELSNLLGDINPSLKVIFTTGDTSEETINRIKETASLGYVTKPCSLKDIYALVAKAEVA